MLWQIGIGLLSVEFCFGDIHDSQVSAFLMPDNSVLVIYKHFEYDPLWHFVSGGNEQMCFYKELHPEVDLQEIVHTKDKNLKVPQPDDMEEMAARLKKQREDLPF